MSDAMNGALEHFYSFVESNERELNRAESLEEYIDQWLVEGGGGNVCCRDATYFYATVASIFAHWHDVRQGSMKDPNWNYVIPRRITRAFKNTDATHGGTEIFNPFYFLMWSHEPPSA